MVPLVLIMVLLLVLREKFSRQANKKIRGERLFRTEQSMSSFEYGLGVPAHSYIVVLMSAWPVSQQALLAVQAFLSTCDPVAPGPLFHLDHEPGN